ncbi:hypothetical protein FHS21_003608 [Phyllobacterium trifolii]|jgi:hypothetical protein|uniref:DUF4169 family protein n=1 Tax=Phyllobacterium trifolii TaxID=300193 RepID=A0A839UE95_9HYPH|nr:DUF4169 family protein [Phyllobacterium trifolii]MBB3147192.1 hypothetical protein [Phyllobacterium trifolii]
MAEIVNLRLIKKRKGKEAAEKTAAENRVLFGRTKAEKQFDREANRKKARFLDDHRLETNPSSTEDDTDGK